MRPRLLSVLTCALYLCSSLPLLALTTVYADGLYTASVLGHMPRLCMDNTPNTPVGSALYWLTYFAATGAYFSPMAWLLLIGLNRAQTPRSDWRVHAVLYSLGWGLVFGLSYIDPGGIISWWVD